jgi:hypothetical protein
VSPVTVGELETTITPERQAPAGPAEATAAPAWVETDRLRRAASELERDRARLRAEGLDA